MTKAIIIGMKHNPISQRYLETIIPNARKMLSCEIEVMEAIRPGDPIIDHDKFSAIKGPTKGTKDKPWSETEKAVWYSHICAWKKILDQEDDAVWVLEHDAFVSIPPKFHYGINSIWGNAVGQARAYVMRPFIIERMLKDFENAKVIDMQIDTWMTKWMADRAHTTASAETFLVNHMQDHGTTIEHL
jgi:hypothetical protein